MVVWANDDVILVEQRSGHDLGVIDREGHDADIEFAVQQSKLDGPRAAIGHYQLDLGRLAASSSTRIGVSQRAVVPITPTLTSPRGEPRSDDTSDSSDASSFWIRRTRIETASPSWVGRPVERSMRVASSSRFEPGNVGRNVGLDGVGGLSRSGEATVIDDREEGL